MNTQAMRADGTQTGFVLVSSLLILFILSILAVSMFHNFTLQERMSANLKDKARAFQMAQSTLQNAEYLLSLSATTLPEKTSCTAPQLVTTICDNTVSVQNATSSNPAMNIANGTTYSTMQPPISVSTTGGAGTYYAYPQFYVHFLGLAPGGTGKAYRITALGYGGDPRAVAVVQSTYLLTTGVRNLGTP